MITTVAETGSTNADLLTRLKAGETIAEGDWLRAERQTGGRGRSGREWTSLAGNLHASTVVHLRASDPAPHTLSLATGLALFATLKPLLGSHRNLMLKWPNDVLVDGAKIAGILLERAADSVVIGIGVNIAAAPDLPDRTATCLRACQTSAMLDAAVVLDLLAAELAQALDRWRDEGEQALYARWRAAAHPVGTRLSVHGGDGATMTGAFAGLAPDGALILRLANGEERVIHAGDVALMGN